MKVLGITDSVTTCDCCGKQNLKKTYVMDNLQGEIFHYGVSCGSKASGMPTDSIKKEVKEIEFKENFEGAKTQALKIKMMKSAINKGIYTKDEFFKKYGKLEEETPWQMCYVFEYLHHSIKK